MPVTYDLAPPASEIARLAAGVDDDSLGAPTPCEDWSVAALLDHLLGLTVAFAAAATKDSPLAGGVDTNGALPGDWRVELRKRLDSLVFAWHATGAWEGEATVRGMTLPAEVMGVVALDELVLHGWDLARATGQRFHADPTSIKACLDFAASMSDPGQEASRAGLFGPVVSVPDDAADLDRLLGYAGRNPQWTAGG